MARLVDLVIHQGVRYEAPHEECIRDKDLIQLSDADEMRSILNYARVQDKTSAHRLLIESGFPSDQVELVLESRPESLKPGRRKFSLSGLLDRLSPPSHSSAGCVRAYDSTSNQHLWSLRVYHAVVEGPWGDSVCYVGSLEIEDGLLVVRDLKRWLHKVDTAARRVVFRGSDPHPTPRDIAASTARDWNPRFKTRMQDLRLNLSMCLDQYNAQAFYGQTPEAAALLQALGHLLGGLGEVRHQHPLFQRACNSGSEKAQSIQAGADAHILYDWLRDDLDFFSGTRFMDPSTHDP